MCKLQIKDEPRWLHTCGKGVAHAWRRIEPCNFNLHIQHVNWISNSAPLTFITLVNWVRKHRMNHFIGDQFNANMILCSSSVCSISADSVRAKLATYWTINLTEGYLSYRRKFGLNFQGFFKDPLKHPYHTKHTLDPKVIDWTHICKPQSEQIIDETHQVQTSILFRIHHK